MQIKYGIGFVLTKWKPLAADERSNPKERAKFSIDNIFIFLHGIVLKN